MASLQGYPLSLGQWFMHRFMNDPDLRMSQGGAAGFVGNGAKESAGFTTGVQKLNSGNEGPGKGFWQWDDRGPAFANFLINNGFTVEKNGVKQPDYTSPEGNFQYAKHELLNTPEGKILARLQDPNITAADASRIVHTQFERPFDVRGGAELAAGDSRLGGRQPTGAERAAYAEHLFQNAPTEAPAIDPKQFGKMAEGVLSSPEFTQFSETNPSDPSIIYGPGFQEQFGPSGGLFGQKYGAFDDVGPQAGEDFGVILQSPMDPVARPQFAGDPAPEFPPQRPSEADLGFPNAPDPSLPPPALPGDLAGLTLYGPGMNEGDFGLAPPDLPQLPSGLDLPVVSSDGFGAGSGRAPMGPAADAGDFGLPAPAAPGALSGLDLPLLASPDYNGNVAPGAFAGGLDVGTVGLPVGPYGFSGIDAGVDQSFVPQPPAPPLQEHLDAIAPQLFDPGNTHPPGYGMMLDDGQKLNPDFSFEGPGGPTQWEVNNPSFVPDQPLTPQEIIGLHSPNLGLPAPDAPSLSGLTLYGPQSTDPGLGLPMLPEQASVPGAVPNVSVPDIGLPMIPGSVPNVSVPDVGMPSVPPAELPTIGPQTFSGIEAGTFAPNGENGMGQGITPFVLPPISDTSFPGQIIGGTGMADFGANITPQEPSTPVADIPLPPVRPTDFGPDMSIPSMTDFALNSGPGGEQGFSGYGTLIHNPADIADNTGYLPNPGEATFPVGSQAFNPTNPPNPQAGGVFASDAQLTPSSWAQLGNGISMLDGDPYGLKNDYTVEGDSIYRVTPTGGGERIGSLPAGGFGDASLATMLREYDTSGRWGGDPLEMTVHPSSPPAVNPNANPFFRDLGGSTFQIDTPDTPGADFTIWGKDRDIYSVNPDGGGTRLGSWGDFFGNTAGADWSTLNDSDFASRMSDPAALAAIDPTGMGGAAPAGSLGGQDFAQSTYMGLVAKLKADQAKIAAQNQAFQDSVNQQVAQGTAAGLGINPAAAPSFFGNGGYVAPANTFQPNFGTPIFGGGGGIGGGGQTYF